MLAFVEGRADVLVATTIIENGLDIPRANTLIVNRADRYGLAQLYQLRGRVGRSDRRAYAYLLVPPDTVLSEIARKRLAAIREFSELGAGFRIAALDLELRGAGNLLGGEQSGHIEAVGLDLYVKLLEQTILELQGRGAAARRRAPALNLRRRPAHPRGLRARGAPAHGALQARQPGARTPPRSRALRERDPRPLRRRRRPRCSACCATRRCGCARRRSGIAQVDLAGGALAPALRPEHAARARGARARWRPALPGRAPLARRACCACPLPAQAPTPSTRSTELLERAREAWHGVADAHAL